MGAPLLSAVGLCVAGAILAGCGSASAAAGGTGGGRKGPSAAGSGSGSACAKGAAAAGAHLTVPAEAATTVATPSGACWASIATTKLGQVENGTVPPGDSTTFQMAWSPTALYILAHTVEWPLYPNDTQWYNGDATEYDLTGQSGGSTFDASSMCHMGLTEDNQIIMESSECTLPIPPTSAIQIVSNKGFYSELTVPWAALGVSAAAKGQAYLFDIGEDFGSGGGTRVAQAFWQGTPNGSPDWPKNPAVWGTVTLG